MERRVTMSSHRPNYKVHSPSLHVRRIWVPEGTHSTLALFLLALGIVVSFGLFTGISLAVIDLFRAEGKDSGSSVVLVIIAMLVGTAGLVAWVTVYARTRRKLAVRTKMSRMARLQKLLRRQDFGIRLPHRKLEGDLLARGWTTGRISKAIDGTKDRIAIMVNGPTLCAFPRPMATSLGFEPVPLEDSGERLLDLLASNMWEQGGSREVRSSRETMQSKRSRRNLREALGPIRGVLGVVIIACLVLEAIFSRGEDLIFAALFIVSVGLLYFWPEVMGRQWYLVPGGLVFREYRSWRKVSRVGLVTPDNSPLLVHYAESYALVRVRGRFVRFECPDWSGWCVLAAWISTAARPTREEILAFFGADAEWEK